MFSRLRHISACSHNMFQLLGSGMGFLFDIFTESGLLDMYAKCGSIQYAKQHFDNAY